MNQRETEERLHANDTIIDMLIRRQDKTDGVLSDHVSMCGRLQKVQIVIGCVILLLIEAHSPEAGQLVGKVVKGLLG